MTAMIVKVIGEMTNTGTIEIGVLIAVSYNGSSINILYHYAFTKMGLTRQIPVQHCDMETDSEDVKGGHLDIPFNNEVPVGERKSIQVQDYLHGCSKRSRRSTAAGNSETGKHDSTDKAAGHRS
ncbi:hypothetical protein TIFTF001_026832 [Ficus carica]|uniref:Uncharacterized protein n=1 Tax=Ficus carica TaxID=3494 RepID=A0AA88IU46_FICCA|nr:hypothetical protein TIFTF001_026832 [Ficus carica]